MGQGCLCYTMKNADFSVMKDASPKKLAFIAALLIMFAFAGIMLFADMILGMEVNHIISFGGGLLLFIVSYSLFYYILNNFIYNKIRLVYKTIHELKAPRGERQEQLYQNSDIIQRANEEVAAWASDKKREIEDLKKLEAYRREFLGNVSHELKTPIFNIQGYVLTLLDGGLDDPKVNRSYLLRTEKSINRMISIVEDLEAISKLESGEVKLKFSHFDMTMLAREVMEMLEMDASQKNIRFAFRDSQEVPVMVYADRQNIHQVVTNLMANAIKYGRDNGHVKVSFFDMDEHILTEITDSGIGIPREELPRVFERFYRGEKSRTRNQGGGGSGLGLAIVKHIIEAHHQTINVRSTLGIGTTFAFTLKKGKSVGNSYGSIVI